MKPRVSQLATSLEDVWPAGPLPAHAIGLNKERFIAGIDKMTATISDAQRRSRCVQCPDVP